MKRVIFLLLLGMIIASEVQAQMWPNEPAGSKILVDCNFDTVTCGVLKNVYNGGSVMSDTSTSSVPTTTPANVLRNLLPGTQTSGGVQLDYYMNAPDVYVGFWVIQEPSFQGATHNFNKLGYVTIYDIVELSGPPGSSSWQMVFQLQNPGLWNNCHLPGYGDCPGTYVAYSSCTFTKGRWNRVEIYFKRSTTATSLDGRLKLWLNGMACADWPINQDKNFDLVSIPNAAWDGSFAFQQKTQDWEYRFDHLHVSTTGGTTSNTAPPAPTGLSVY